METGKVQDAGVPHARFAWIEKHAPESENLGLFAKLSYYVHRPKTKHNIPHSEGFILWNILSDHQPIHENRPSMLIRIMSLTFIFLMVIGPAMGYASVGALASQIKEEYSVSDSQVAILFAVYSLPNIFFVLVGGVLMDKLGVNISCLIFVTLFVIGNIIPIIGNSYASLMAGRILYGVGNECINLIQYESCVLWFQHDPSISLAFANAVGLLAYRVAGFLSLFVIPIFGEISLWAALAFCAGVSVFSGLLAISLVLLNKRYEWYIHYHGDMDMVKKSEHKQPTKEASDEEKKEQSSNNFSWTTLKSLGVMFWVSALLCMVSYNMVLSFLAFLVNFISSKWNMSDSESSQVGSIIFIIPTVLVCFVGFGIDRWGHRVSAIALASAVSAAAYIIMATSDVSPYVGCSLLGLAYSLAPAAIWPIVPLVTKEELLGTAYGIFSMLMNLGLFLFPVIVSAISTSSTFPIWALLLMSLISLGVSGVLMVLDMWHKWALEKTCIVKTKHAPKQETTIVVEQNRES